jgi:protein SCO1
VNLWMAGVTAVKSLLKIAGLLLVVTVAFTVVAQSPEKRTGAVTIGKIQIEIPDLLVVDQNGVKRRFYSDLIKDKIVVLSFFFTSCPSFCPAMNLTLTKLQTSLGDRIGKDVFLVTVTKDPETDTPARLKAWGKGLHIKSGWTMVTGDVNAIGKIVLDFTGDGLGQDSHNTIFIIGNDKTGSWADLSGYSSPDDLRRQIDAVTAPPEEEAAGEIGAGAAVPSTL